ncbi:Ion transport protein-domain-containing protein [Dichotomocladium elegans]|nr:Ion transport protein-domain-containing protein [Dichotomocladium elegans]
MPDPECEPKGHARGSRHGAPSSPPVPQITFTDAQDDHSHSSTSVQQQLPYPPHSPNSLHPTLNHTPPPPSPAPLPLTRDILRRKNKLDRLLHDGNKKKHDEGMSPQPPPIMTFNADSNIVMDERITAGLGISTPSANTQTNTFDSSNLRHRRHSARPSISTNITSIMENNIPKITQKSPPPSPQVNEYFSWTYDLDLKSTGHSGSIKDHMVMMLSGASTAATSQSGSSINKSNAQPYNEKQLFYSRYPHPQPPPYSYQPFPINDPSNSSHPHGFQRFLAHFSDAASRVVNLRGPEEPDDALLIRPEETSRHPSFSRRGAQATDIVSIYANDTDRHTGLSTPCDKRSIASRRLSVIEPPYLERSECRSLYSEFSSTAKQGSGQPESKATVFSEPVEDHAATPRIQIPLAGNSLFVFAPHNPIRRYIWKYVMRSRLVEGSLMILMIIHYLLLVCVPIYENSQKTVFGAQWTHYPILCIQMIYTLEAICKIIVYGLWIHPSYSAEKRPFHQHIIRRIIPGRSTRPVEGDQGNSAEPQKIQFTHRAYLSGFANWMDVVALSSYWIDLGLMVNAYPYCSLFKALAAMRPLRLAVFFKGISNILRSLLISWDMLKEVTGFIFFFFVLFALIGLISFNGVFSRRCFAIGPSGEQMIVDPPLFCTGYYNGSEVIGAYNPVTGEHSYPGYDGYICANNQICLELQANNPNYGFVNFDTIYFALLTVYTTVSLELWAPIMYQNQSADSRVTALFYCLVAYFLSFILVFMIIAVITSGFSRVKAAHRISAFTGKKKRTRVLRIDQNDEEELIWRYEDPKSIEENNSRRVKRIFIKLAKSKAFFYLGGSLVALDMAFMCGRSVNASDDTLEIIDNAETAFTFLFALEIFARIIGSTSWLHFWASLKNKFDLFLVIVTCVIQLPMIQDMYAYKYLTIFQCLRIYRLFLCIPRVRHLLAVALGTGEGVAYVVSFLLLFSALFAPIFMQLFGGDFTFIGYDEPTLRCDTFWQSYLTLIMLYTSETWTNFLYNAMESQYRFAASYAAIITSVYFAFARYVMSGLYIAVILENFELEDEDIKRYQIGQFIQKRNTHVTHRAQSLIHRFVGLLYFTSAKKQVDIPRLPTMLTASISKDDLIDILVGNNHHAQDDARTGAEPINIKPRSGYIDRWMQCLSMKRTSTKKHTEANAVDQIFQDQTDDYELIVQEENREAQVADMPSSKSLFIFSPNNRFRLFCKSLAGSTADGRSERQNIFNWLIMACVLASTFMVIFDEPSTRIMRQDSFHQSVYGTVDLALTIIFVTEIGIRVVADGFILPPNAFLRNPWNRLDFTVVFLNLAATFTESSDITRVLGTVRSLRILRLIRYFSGMRDVFIDLFHAFPYMMDSLLLVFLVMVFFSIYGVNILSGRMFTCNDQSVSRRSECTGEFLNDVGSDRLIPILQPRVWAIPQEGMYSYDNFPTALAHLFAISSTEGWIDSLFYAMSAPPYPGLQPKFSWDSPSAYHSIFYVIFMVISHGTLQLFVGVIIEKFKQRAGITTMTTKQRQYADLRRQLAEIRPTPKARIPKHKLGRLCHQLVANKRGPFNRIMLTFVILNVCVIATEYQNQPPWLTSLQDYLFVFFIAVYIIESAVKLIGLGFRKWSRSKWNWYDVFIALSAFILQLLRFALPDLWTLRLERYCLVLAAFRLGENIDSLQTLYHTVRMSLPKIIRVSAVFMLVLCLFAMIFMELFGLTKYGLETNDYANFRDYGSALLLLLRTTTGEAWNIIMMDSAVQAPNCVASDDYLQTDCGYSGWAYFLFNASYLICTHIFLNLFTAAVLSNFEYAYEARSRFTLITKEDLRYFKQAWSAVDPSGSGFIQRRDVAKFLRLLKGRFRINIYDEKHSIANLVKLSKTGISSPVWSPGKPVEKLNGVSSFISIPMRVPYNIQEVIKCLDSLDAEEMHARRREYNMYYLEICAAETSKGIAFEDVRTILSYRFVDIEEALLIDQLIERLERLDQLKKAYATERARGVFLTVLQRRRYLRDLWHQKNDAEMRKLGISSKSPLQLDTSLEVLSPRSPAMSRQLKHRSPVPTIVIEDAPPSPLRFSDYVPSPGSLHIPLSPMSNHSLDSQCGSPVGAGAVESLNVGLGTLSPQASPFPPSDPEETISLNGGLFTNSPHSPTLVRHNWRFIDGNQHIPSELAESLMRSLDRSSWSDMLSDES